MPIYRSPFASDDLTDLQKLQLEFLKKKEKKGRSFFGNIGHGLNEALQFITRPSYAIAEGTRRGLEGEGFEPIDFLKGFSRGIQGKAHTGFGQVLEQEGLLKGHRRARGILGFGLDIATDPTMLAAVAAAPITGGASLSILAAKGASRGAIAKASAFAVKESRNTKNFGKLEEARNVLRSAGEGFESQTALLTARLARLDRPAEHISQLDRRALRAMEAEARVERIRSLGGSYLGLSYKIPFGPRFATPGLVRAPSITRFANESKLRDVPGLSVFPRAAEGFANAFKPGWKEPKFHATRMIMKRIAQAERDENIKIFRELFKPFLFGKHSMKEDDVFNALAFGETAKNIVKPVKGGESRLDNKILSRAVNSGELTQRQANMLKTWHKYMEHLRKRDLEFDISYKPPKDNVLYVPHFYGKQGEQIIGSEHARSILNVPGYKYDRLAKRPHSVKQLHELYTKGIYKKELETNPIRLAIIRGSRGAQAHAEAVGRRVVANSFGVSTKMPNVEKLQEAFRIMHKAQEGLSRLKLLDEKHLQKVRFGALVEASRLHVERANKIKLEYRTKKRKALAKIRTLKTEFKYVEEKRYLKEGAKIIRTYKLFGITPNQAKGLIKAQIRRQENLIKKYEKDMQEELSKNVDRTRLKEADLTRRIDERLETELNRGNSLNNTIARQESNLQKHQTSKNSPVVNHPNFVTEPKLIGDNGFPLAVPVDMSASLHRIEKAVVSDQFLREFSNLWDKNVGRWKVLATVVNPGYRIRNTISDMWNMFVRGVPIWAINYYGIQSARLMYKALKKGDKKALQEFKEAFDHGIFAGLFQGDIDRVMQALRFEHPARSFRFARAYGKLMMDFNRNAENWGRYTHYLYARHSLKQSPAEAAARVRETHFDYEDLTPFEQAVKRNIVPFYTWTRKNIPFQITSMLARPGRYATFQKAINESEYIAEEGGPAGLVPNWLEKSLAFRAPFGKGNYIIPDFGPADLTYFGNPSQLTGLLGPGIKAPFELAFNKSLFTGAPIHGNERTHPLEPVSAPAGMIAKLLSLGGTTERNVGGKELKGPGAHPIFSYLANLIPPAGFAVSRTSNIRAAQRGGYTNPLLSYFGGIGAYAPDQRAAERGLMEEHNKEFRQYIRGLRDKDKISESEISEDSPFQQQLKGILKKQAKIY